MERVPHLHVPRTGARRRLRHRGVGPGPDLHDVGHLQLRPRRAGDAGARSSTGSSRCRGGCPPSSRFVLVVGVFGPLIGMALLPVPDEGPARRRRGHQGRRHGLGAARRWSRCRPGSGSRPSRARSSCSSATPARSTSVGVTVRYGEIFVVLAAVALAGRAAAAVHPHAGSAWRCAAWSTTRTCCGSTGSTPSGSP